MRSSASPQGLAGTTGMPAARARSTSRLLTSTLTRAPMPLLSVLRLARQVVRHDLILIGFLEHKCTHLLAEAGSQLRQQHVALQNNRSAALNVVGNDGRYATCADSAADKCNSAILTRDQSPASGSVSQECSRGC
jgi:hypothetical protein